MTVLGTAQMSVVAANASTVVIVFGGLIEAGRQLTRRASTWRDLTTAALMGFGGLLVGSMIGVGFVSVFDLVGRFAPATLPWDGSPLLSFIAAFVAWDAVGYAYHWLGHRTRLGWAAHQPHHTGQTYDLTLAWRQSWLPVHGIVLPLVALGGWSLSTIVVCAAISNTLQAFQHVSAWHRAPRPIRAVFQTAVQHRHHHLSDQGSWLDRRQAVAVNLGPVFTVWDRLVGTYLDGTVSPDASYGVRGLRGDRLFVAQFAGWRALLDRSGQAASMAETESRR